MALDVQCIFEVRQTGSDTNGGGFAKAANIVPPAAAPTLATATTGGTVTAGTYYIVVTYTDAIDQTLISPEASITTTGSTSTITVSSPAAFVGANSWGCHVGTVVGGPYTTQATGLTIGSSNVITAPPPITGPQPPGVIYAWQDNPQINLSNGQANGTTSFTSAGAGFNGSHVGNLIRVGTINWRRIVSVQDSSHITLDAAVPANVGLPVVVGGAFKSPGIVIALGPVAQSNIFLKYSPTPYTMIASSAVSNGSLSSASAINLIGFDNDRRTWNRDANRPTIQPAANGVTMFTNFDQNFIINNVIFSNPGGFTGCRVFSGTSADQQAIISNVKVSGFTDLLAAGQANECRWMFCDISVTNQASLGYSSKVDYCDWHDGGGLKVLQWSAVRNCNFYNISGAFTGALQFNGPGCQALNNNFYHITCTLGGVGSAIQTDVNAYIVNNVIEDVNPASGVGYAFDSNITPQSVFTFQNNVINCFVFNIKTAPSNPLTISPPSLVNLTVLTASPFSSPGTGNFAPNNTTGGGTLVRSASLPTTFPAGTSVNHHDAGAVQSVVAVGGIKVSSFGEVIVGALRAK